VTKSKNKTKTKSGKMWGGRFQGELDEVFAEYQRSLPVDHVLAFADLEVNRKWCTALAACGVFTAAELQRVHAAIDELEAAWAADGVPDEPDAEDVHSLVELELEKRCGELARRIHTGRSRNDQVATDLRLFLRELMHGCLEGIAEVVTALVRKAEKHWAVPIPGYTHLQRAQPLTIGHHALAHVEALRRDRGRFLDAWARMDQCPLGAGALAGTALRVDREALARELGFLHGPTRNSLDATSARDHACEVAFCCAMTLTHLSRLAEDYIFFSSQEAGFLRFGDAVSTGSSLMPQKRNPDAMELVRGKTGAAHGHLIALLTMLKGLPLAYNRDLQHDKASLFDSLMDCDFTLHVAALAVQHAEFDVERCRAEAEKGYLNATDLADLLVARGVASRDAHEQVGRAVNRALELGVELQDLSAADRRELLPQLDGELRELLSAAAVLARRDVVGGTAPHRVREEVARWRQELAEWNRPFAGPEEDA
jgi:argininosuccinate lyase